MNRFQEIEYGKALLRKERIDSNDLQKLNKALNCILNQTLSGFANPNFEALPPQKKLLLCITRFYDAAKKYSLEIPPMPGFFKSDKQVYEIANQICYCHQLSLKKSIRGIWLEKLDIRLILPASILYLGTGFIFGSPDNFRNNSKEMDRYIIHVPKGKTPDGVPRYVRFLPCDLKPGEEHQKHGVFDPHIHIQNGAGLNIHIPVSPIYSQTSNKTVLYKK